MEWISMKEKILIGGLTVGILLGSTPGLAENFNKLDANTSYISYRMDNKSKEALIKSKQDYINNKKKSPVTNKTEALKNKEDFIKNKQEIINNNKAEGLKNREEALKNKEDFIKNKQEIINTNKAEGLKNREEALKNKEDFIKNKQEIINNNKAEGLKNREEALKNKEDFIKNKQEIINNKVKLKDIKKDNWFYDDVQELVDLGGLSGYEDGTFRPNNKISLGEFLKLSMTSIGQTKYEKINGEHWAMPYYNEAIKEGIIKTDDFGNTAVDFNRPISREDMSYIIMNINSIMQDEKFEDTAGVEENIRDYKNINPNRKKQVYQAYKKGIITGKGNGFNPKDSTTRAEAATVIMRSLNPENRTNNR